MTKVSATTVNRTAIALIVLPAIVPNVWELTKRTSAAPGLTIGEAFPCSAGPIPCRRPTVGTLFSTADRMLALSS